MSSQWKFYQIRQLTRPLDQTYEDDGEYVKQMQKDNIQRQVEFRSQQIIQEEEILKEWDKYKFRLVKQMIIDCTNATNPMFKICICDFINDKKLSMEIWIKIAHDIFLDELDGRNLRGRYWNTLRMKQHQLQDDLSIKNWPSEWDYLEDEPCLCLDMIKLYESYPQIRKFIAENANQLNPKQLSIDIRRMPQLVEDKGAMIEAPRKTWFPTLNFCSAYQLDAIYQANSVFCNHIILFCVQMKDIVVPILDHFRNRGEAGSVVNIYGDQFLFIFEVLFSLRAVSSLAVRVTQQSLKVDKNYKGGNDQKAKEESCKVVLALLSQSDINEEVLHDIYKNLQEGYSTFSSSVNGFKRQILPKLVLMVSERKLNVKMPRSDDIVYHQIPDEKIAALLNSIDYHFLIYYSNLLFARCQVVQQSSSQRKPFFQLMQLMWSYVFPQYFSHKDERLTEHPIFAKMQNLENQIEIEFSDSDFEDSESEEGYKVEYQGKLKKIVF